MLTQRKLCLQIVDAGGAYLCRVKENQPQLDQDVATLFEPEACVKGFSPPTKDFRSAESTGKEHGRRETRRITVSRLLKGYTTWLHLEQVFKLVRQVQEPHKPPTVEIGYGITRTIIRPGASALGY